MGRRGKDSRDDQQRCKRRTAVLAIYHSLTIVATVSAIGIATIGIAAIGIAAVSTVATVVGSGTGDIAAIDELARTLQLHSSLALNRSRLAFECNPGDSAHSEKGTAPTP